MLRKIIAFLIVFSLYLIPVFVFGAIWDQNPGPDTYFNFSPADLNGTPSGGTFQLPGIARTDPRAIVTNVISIISGFLGIIAVVIILISGFQWMTAGGEEDAVKKAQTRLVQGVIGLVLVLSTWSIAYYVVNILAANIFKEF